VTVQWAYKLKFNVGSFGVRDGQSMYLQLPTTVDEPQEHITAAVNSVMLDML